jgi:hypothetical protein
VVNEKDCAIYWSVWGRVQQVRPDLDRAALTRRTLGHTKSHKEFTRAEWGRMLAAFNAILKKNQP